MAFVEVESLTKSRQKWCVYSNEPCARVGERFKSALPAKAIGVISVAVSVLSWQRLFEPNSYGLMF
jgi:hypothetical protein